MQRAFNRKNLGADNLDDFITITTYQSIEQRLKSNEPYNEIRWIEKFDYVVCDECHYFLNDSNFNTYTELSFDCIRTHFNFKIQIYMSATIDNTVYFIKNRVSSLLCPGVNDVLKNTYKEYNIPRDYEYVKLKFFNNQEELKQIITNNKDSDKWLIFTDSIASGKELRDYLIEYLKNEDSFSKNIDSQIGFIDAKFDDDSEGTKIMEQIATEDMTSMRILIATAVIDNGISLKDYDLRNIVIMADTEESFVQMLGRKRPDGHDVTVYICKRDEGYFKRRLQYIDSILKLYKNIRSDYTQMYGKTESNGHIFPYHACAYSVCNPHAERSYQIPLQINLSLQSNTLEKIFSNARYYEYAKKICYPIYGCVTINNFAVHKYRLLEVFYKDMISELQQDENAFIRKQASVLYR